MLGLEGAVTDAPFEALRANRDWQTGKRLTWRANKKTRMALFGIQVSAPKEVSVLAIAGSDERVREGFVVSVQAMLVDGAFRCSPRAPRPRAPQRGVSAHGELCQRNVPVGRHSRSRSAASRSCCAREREVGPGAVAVDGRSSTPR